MTIRGIALIVEDRADWQHIFEKTFQLIDWQYDVAATYDDAMILLSQKFYDVAVIDPVLDNSNKYNRDGLRVLMEINQRYPITALLVVSGSVTLEKLKQYPNMPPNIPFMEKPNWDRELFKGMVLNAAIQQNEMGGRTLLSLMRSSETVKKKSQEMPTLPDDVKRQGVPRILIVEDRADWQNILATTIEEEGWVWKTVTAADEALNLLRDKEERYHVVLLDLRLGEADIPIQAGAGWQLLDFLSQKQSRTQVVIVSGEASRGDVATLYTKYPIQGFIDKDTFKKNELLELLYKLTDTPEIRIQTMGNFQVWRDGQDVDDFGADEVEELLMILVSKQGEPIRIDELGKLLFNDTSATAAVQAVISAASRILEPNLVTPDESNFILNSQANHYRLNLDAKLMIDFVELSNMLEEGKRLQELGRREQALQQLEQARALYEGEYLPNRRTTQWSVPVRNYVDKQAARLYNRLADLYAVGNEFDRAIKLAQACLQIDAYHESTHRRLMRFHYCADDKAAALTVYQTLSKLKSEFFQEEPDDKTQQLYTDIEADKPIHCIEPS